MNKLGNEKTSTSSNANKKLRAESIGKRKHCLAKSSLKSHAKGNTGFYSFRKIIPLDEFPRPINCQVISFRFFIRTIGY